MGSTRSHARCGPFDDILVVHLIRWTLILGCLLALAPACRKDRKHQDETDVDTDPPGLCDTTGDCQACLECVDADNLCAAESEVCALNGECTAIGTCAEGCAGDAACVEACVASHPSGAVDYTLVNSCQSCEQCAGACAAEATGCPEVPGVPQIVVPGTSDQLLLQGVLVTPTGAWAGEVLVENDLITCVAPTCSGESAVATATIVVTHGVVMPGMIDAHNHVQYSIFDESDWSPGQLYGNHNQWANDPLYDEMVDAKQYLNGEGDSPIDLSCEMNKYGELKALIAGTTSVQGSANPANKICFRTLARTIDQSANGLCGTDPPQSCPDGVQAATLFPSNSAADAVCDNLTDGSTNAYVVHLGEGVDESALSEFDELYAATTVEGCLFAPETAIIHGTAFGAPEFAEMGSIGMGLVWSPRSNVFLYGLGTDLTATTDIPLARAQGIVVGLGPDWSLGGSQHLLDEMRFADQVDNAVWGDTLTPRDLVEMATLNSAHVLGVDSQIGALTVGMKADLAVLGGDTDAPYDAILAASPREVRLVLVDGKALYGDDQLSLLGAPTPGCEAITICGESKFLCVAIDGGDASDKFGQTYAEIEAALVSGLADYDGLEIAPLDFSPLAPLVTCPP